MAGFAALATVERYGRAHKVWNRTRTVATFLDFAVDTVFRFDFVLYSLWAAAAARPMSVNKVNKQSSIADGTATERLSQAATNETAVREQLQRIVSSETFRRAERLKKFLEYICDLTLAGQGESINEYLIGTEVFERGPSYSPAEDSVVRRQARSLRLKLSEYYEDPGVGDPLLIQVPKGGYVPVFARNEPSQEEGEQISDDESDAADVPTPKPRGGTGPGRVWAAVAIAVLSFLAGLAASRLDSPDGRSAKASIDPALAELWAPWLGGESVVICFSNPLNILLKHYPAMVDPAPNGFRLQEDLHSGVADAVRSFFGLQGGHLYVWPDITAAKMGESMGAVSLGAFFGGQGIDVRATQSRFLDWQDFRHDNLIVLGHNEQNPWVDPLLDEAPLRMLKTSGELARRIVNTDPGRGEPRIFELDTRKEGPDIEYALISMLPGVDGRRALLLIGGLNTQAGQVAMEFLTEPAGARQLLEQLRTAEPEHRGPWTFQAVLRTETRDKVPSGAEIVHVKIVDRNSTEFTANSR